MAATIQTQRHIVLLNTTVRLQKSRTKKWHNSCALDHDIKDVFLPRLFFVKFLHLMEYTEIAVYFQVLSNFEGDRAVFHAVREIDVIQSIWWLEGRRHSLLTQTYQRISFTPMKAINPDQTRETEQLNISHCQRMMRVTLIWLQSHALSCALIDFEDF